METEVKNNVDLVGVCDKMLVDFCSKETDKIILSLDKDGETRLSAELSRKNIVQLIQVLENLPSYEMVELSDGRNEKRPMHNLVQISNAADDRIESSVSISPEGSSFHLGIQNNLDNTVLGYAQISKVEIGCLIGVLYIWLGNRHLSSRTILSMFKKSNITFGTTEVVNIRLPGDMKQ